MLQTNSISSALNESMSSTLVTPEQLKTFLTEAPLMYKNKLHKGAKKHILTNCYRSLWSNDLDLMQKYFFKEGLSDSDNLSQLLEKYNLFGSEQHDHEDQQSNPNLSINKDDEPEYWESQRGKQCGHLFKKGESVYRCRNCGLDDTCVMCSKCFHSTNHDGHDVKIWISRGAGGCCDCGDPEAWKIPLECSIHSLNAASKIPDSSMSAQHQLEPLSSVPQSIIHSVRKTISVVLDYILETFATSPEDVISVGTTESIKQDCYHSHEALGLPVNAPNQTYSCILWNDEKHSFDAVINIVCEALGCTKEEAAYCAECVDEYGRHIIKESTDIDELIRIADTINSINLAVTICSSQKTLREEIAGLLLDWLKDLTGGRYKFFSNVDSGSCIIRDIICEVLSEDWVLRPELAWLSIRYRRERMPEDENDEFDLESADTDMGNDEGNDDMVFIDDMEDINEEDVLLDEDQIDHFFNHLNEEGSDDGDYEDADEMPTISFQIEQNNDMDTDEVEDTNLSTRQPISVENTTRRRQSDVPSTNQTDAHILSTSHSSQGRYNEALKRRRLSSSSQSKGHKSHKPRDILDMEWNLEAWLEYTNRLESEERELAEKLGIPIENEEVTTSRHMNTHLKKEFKRKLRLDYLLQFDLRLWKTARVSIKDLLIGTFISNFQYRPILGTRFARNYPELVDAFFFKDREPENSISTLSVQLLTVPTVASMLVKEYKFFEIVCTILENFFLTDHIYMTLPEEYSRAQVDCSSRAIGRHRYAYTIFDLRYVMNAEQVKAVISKNPLYLRHFVDMLYQFQEMDPLLRKADAHVEFESQSWVTAFNMTLQTSKLCRLFAGCFGSSEMNVHEASRNLCRSIYRVLKEIVDWNPILVSRKVDGEPIPDTRIKIKGLKEQQFHQINTPNAGVFEIIDYDITKNPVSFHHPFHWLLSELFENVSLLHPAVLNELGWLGGFKQMVNNAFQDKNHDMFLMVLEYPIRTIALLAQINCGVWVRNGYNIRNQAHSYRDVNVRESTLDCDIYLLQVGLTVCDSNQILLTLMDRFQLVEWFRGKPDKLSTYDANQMNYMVEEFLNLLIICATEHGYASGTSIEQRIGQSIIQFLGISSMAYSELLKLIPESLTEHESFETQLNQLANFKAPDGLNDKGLYELKPEYIDEIEPYYWHYTRNQREEAQNVLKKRWNQLHPDNKLSEKEEFLLIPKSRRIEVGPFRQLGQFLHSHVLCQIIAYALWDAKFHKESKSDTMLDEALYLGMLAVTDPNSSASELAFMKVKGKNRADVYIDESTTKHFVDFAESDEYSIQINEIEKTHASLLLILLRCLNDPELSHAHKRLQFIVDKIEYFGSQKSKELIADWKERKLMESKVKMERDGGSSTSEYEKKKAAAKARQAAIMSQFAKAQTQFMEKHANLYKVEGEEEEEEAVQENEPVKDELVPEDDFEIVRKCHFPADSCIVCQEELNDTKLFGMLGLIQQSNLHRLTLLNNKDVMVDVLESSQNSNPWATTTTTKDDQSSFIGFPADAHVSGLDISSCGHLMHADCFETYQKSVENQLLGEFGRMFPFSISPKSRFLCPLCKALGNVLVPVVWKGKKESFPGVMAPSSDYANLTKHMKDAAAKLRKNFEHIPGSFDEEVPFISNDPNLVISDTNKLRHIYNQLMKVMHATIERRPLEHPLNLPDSLLNLYDMYAYTIANFEIAQRGTEGTRARDLMVEHTGTFIDDVSNTSQMLLKILGMTNTLIRELMNTPWQAEDRFTRERLALQAINQFMPKTITYLVEDMIEADSLKPLLADDSFRALVRMSFVIHDVPSVEIHHLLRTMYIAELTKTIVAIVQSVLDDKRLLKDTKITQLLQTLNQQQTTTTATTTDVKQFVTYILESFQIPQASIEKFFDIIQPSALLSLIRTFLLPFLRKSLLFMVVCHGFIPQNPPENMDEGKQEFENLLDILRLPGLNTVFDLQPFEQDLIKGWCDDYLNHSAQQRQLQKPILSISLNLPTQYKMTTLPYRLDELLDESSKRVCRKCKTVPEHSAICLICGTFVCARRFCCTEGSKGECNTHMKSCGGEIGIYLMIKDCFLLLLHDNGGSIMNAPYLDSHGEADIFFKRGAPQYLNMKRYEQIRQMWLTHSIPSFVRRRMEVAYSATIWEAF
ncbi:uncharacterized protein BX663DRAFT_470639 [Cokeromyces recurvatus]|uniref:uncharacterized protein n=1 Tax=Cokeromyces recurvatus TaxID=90255 RepID=UPI002220AA6B|nr:uncharacterized protein BX663DRAFT_470639 [Cokeromyces recurvatus]KAI7904456.1 hypothetical protein BX663DRAFT_470639 [Cokeromyces recurvatus]